MQEFSFRKIVILGTSGSGKTTFLKNLASDPEGKKFEKSERKRQIDIEEAQILNTFTAVDKQQYENSTTTISMNVQSILFLTTRTNQFLFEPFNSPEEQKIVFENVSDMDELYPTILFDTAGQERFDFMQEIGIKGSDGVIIFADGTNIQSVERISHFYQLVKQEENAKGKSIPIIVFINKQDLSSKGLYVGKDAVIRWIPDLKLDIFETSNNDPESFNLAIRIFLQKIKGFPIDAESFSLRINKIHEVF